MYLPKTLVLCLLSGAALAVPLSESPELDGGAVAPKLRARTSDSEDDGGLFQKAPASRGTQQQQQVSPEKFRQEEADKKKERDAKFRELSQHPDVTQAEAARSKWLATDGTNSKNGKENKEEMWATRAGQDRALGSGGKSGGS